MAINDIGNTFPTTMVQMNASAPCCSSCVIEVYSVSVTNVETHIDTLTHCNDVGVYDLEWGAIEDRYEIRVRVRIFCDGSDLPIEMEDVISKPL